MPFQPRVDYMLSQYTGLIGEPVRQSSFEVSFSRLPNIWMVCNNTNLPNITIDQIEIYHGNEKTKIAGQPDVQNITLELRDTISPDIIRLIENWKNTVYNPSSGLIGYASEYKDRGTVEQYDTKGILIRAWDLFGVWPTSVNYGNLDYQSKDPVLASIDFSVDRAILL